MTLPRSKAKFNYYFGAPAPTIQYPRSSLRLGQSRDAFENPEPAYDLDALDELPPYRNPCACQSTCQNGFCNVSNDCAEGKYPRVLGIPVPFSQPRVPCQSFQDGKSGGKAKHKTKAKSKAKTKSKSKTKETGGYWTYGHGHRIEHPNVLYHHRVHPGYRYKYRHQCRCGSVTGCHCGWYPTLKVKGSTARKSSKKSKRDISSSSSSYSSSF